MQCTSLFRIKKKAWIIIVLSNVPVLTSPKAVGRLINSHPLIYPRPGSNTHRVALALANELGCFSISCGT